MRFQMHGDFGRNGFIQSLFSFDIIKILPTTQIGNKHYLNKLPRYSTFTGPGMESGFWKSGRRRTHSSFYLNFYRQRV